MSTPHRFRAFLRNFADRSAYQLAALGLIIRARHPSLDDAGATDLVRRLGSADGVATDDADLAPLLDSLARDGVILLSPPGRSFAIHALTDRFTFAASVADPDRRLRLSKFAYLRAEDGILAIRSPASDRFFEVHDPIVAEIFGRFASPTRPVDLLTDETAAANVTQLISALAEGGMLLPCDNDGSTVEDREPARRMWEFHDLLFHTRSRRGRSDGAGGASFDFRGDLPEPPGVAPFPDVSRWVALPGPPEAIPAQFVDVLRQRSSLRTFSETPLPLDQLSAFLHYSVRRHAETGRPLFPGGGALYEQRFYIAVDRVAGVAPGLYFYDDVGHRIGLLTSAAAGLGRLLDGAGRAMQAAPPPVLVTIASRFGRVRWKYSGLSYALQLKHVGVIQEAMYLAATALGLGGCALGSGDTSLFGTLAGLDYLEEGAIGEFALGIPAI